jgi:hypothetical protein
METLKAFHGPEILNKQSAKKLIAIIDNRFFLLVRT